ncbi:hypothetical protein GCM10011584_09680 [Nocardioides phosphati]|uniref:Uncharacterized protein n=1 Tax=Nocardioides phosphati TaxID=1867775 RepID=A0ABQ2NC95_9ACTN|nr:hypothetical protein [Nocardioides phosphati]GGO86708.1 hypothetical protein GCM10011584_09680 [Nocardioides phosphati]
MGVDVNLYAETTATDVELAQAEAFFVDRSDLGDNWRGDGIFYVDNSFGAPRIGLQTLSRYYGEHYERGDWPRIYGAIRVMQAAFPGARVFYGGDTTDDGEECTDEMLTRIWRHFLSPNGNDYRKPVRAEVAAIEGAS